MPRFHPEVARKSAEEFWAEKAEVATAFTEGRDEVASTVKKLTYVEPVVES